MREPIFLLTLALPLLTILLVFGMRYGAAILQARARLREADKQQELLDGLNEIKVRLAGIEKILKEVE